MKSSELREIADGEARGMMPADRKFGFVVGFECGMRQAFARIRIAYDKHIEGCQQGACLPFDVKGACEIEEDE